ncbi:phosphonate ABC transporter, permease protein PhnE [Synechococcus sp. Nb3U1]|uniref:phosphonate ABC transporter, permease protein PhnE n=1 Tax=Synechococcus sp. Nb3U1 TaxID=1914529 RepID=UPI001F25270E|nr:phosphonate ABC transporter, permease protein PhnE [Synechococcus sp. Nb3U1]MCF2971550.1 phosphonate ABC transporter, permease protein PhnE [Synechococcus sp. Nb3U1]
MTQATTLSSRKWSPPPLIKNPWVRWGLVVGGIIYLIFAISTLNFDPARVARGIERSGRLLLAFLQPDFTTRGNLIFTGMMESVTMAAISTVAGFIVAVPVGFGASRNLVPMPIYLFCRGLIALSRTFQEVIIAILFVVMFGFGPFAGVLTLTFGSLGFFSKLLAEDIEEIDPMQVEAIRSTGASWLQMVSYAVLPQVLPRMIGLTLYRFDINIREAAILGIVGAGGIGSTLNTSLRRYDYDTASAIILVIIALVMVVELTSGWIRKRVQ